MPTQLPTHFVKVRERGKTAWTFINRNGTNRLRIHAAQFTEEKARALVAQIAIEDPAWEAKIVPIEQGRSARTNWTPEDHADHLHDQGCTCSASRRGPDCPVHYDPSTGGR